MSLKINSMVIAVYLISQLFPNIAGVSIMASDDSKCGQDLVYSLYTMLTGSNATDFNKKNNFLEALTPLFGPTTMDYVFGSAHTNAAAAQSVLFSPQLKKQIQKNMAELALNVATGQTPYGENPTLKDVKVNKKAITDIDPISAMVEAEKAVYPLFKIKNGAPKASSSCEKTGQNGGQASDVCKYLQKIKYAILLINSCHSDYIVGQQATGQCSKKSNSTSQGGIIFQDTGKSAQFSKYDQGCTASLCHIDSSKKPMYQTKPWISINGWSYTAEQMHDLATSDFSKDSDSDESVSQQKMNTLLQNSSKILRAYLSGKNPSTKSSDSALIECEQLKRLSPNSNYSKKSNLPAPGKGFSQKSFGSGQKTIAENARTDMGNISPCLLAIEQTANQYYMSLVYQNAIESGSNILNDDIKNFGSVGTLLGYSNYDSKESDEEASKAILDTKATSLAFTTPSITSRNSALAQYYVYMLMGGGSKTPVLDLPTLNQPSNGGATVLSNGAFITIKKDGDLGTNSKINISSSSESDKSDAKQQVATLRANQIAASQAVELSAQAYENLFSKSSRQKLLVMSVLQEMYLQRFLTIELEGGKHVSMQQIRETLATWRSNPNISYDENSGAFCRSPSDGSIPSKVSQVESGCYTWSTHIQAMKLPELVYEAVNLLSNIYTLQYELSQQQSRIQMIQAINSGVNLQSNYQMANSQAEQIKKLAEQYYQGLVKFNAAQTAASTQNSMKTP